MKSKIDEVVTDNNLNSMAGNRSYMRGLEYFLNGAVKNFYCDGEQLTADVCGTQVYRARITNDNGRLNGECSCPVGRDGDFCKHLVALGLTYLYKQEEELGKKNKSTFSWKEFLQKCDKEELIKIILEMSPNNAAVVERYRMANLPSSPNVKQRELESKVDELISLAEDMEHFDDYWEYEEDNSDELFDEQSELLLKVLEQLAIQEEFKLLFGITTYAIGNCLDSSSSDLVPVREFVNGVIEYFLKAVHALPKSNDKVFNLFLEWEGKGENFGYDIISGILGELPVEIREKWAVGALEKWRSYPPCKLGDSSYNRECSYVERHLLVWANEQKNDRLKLEILEKKMQCAGDVVDLAREYQRQDMQAKVLPLLKKAYKELGGDTAITDLLAEELQKTGNDGEALALAWEEFTKEPMQDTALNRLQAVSSKMKCWNEYYQKALDLLKEQDKKDSKRTSGSFYPYHDSVRQRRVEVLFTHGDQLAAWNLAQGSNLSEEWWLKLAAWRSKEVPKEAASILMQLLDAALRPTGEDAYSHVIQLLQVYRKYLKMANCEAEFSDYCAKIRQKHKRRRLLMEQMDAAKL